MNQMTENTEKTKASEAAPSEPTEHESTPEAPKSADVDPKGEPIRDPGAYWRAQAEKTARVLERMEQERAQERQQVANSLKSAAIDRLLAGRADEDGMLRSYLEKVVSVDDEKLSVDTGDAQAFIDRYAPKSAPEAEGTEEQTARPNPVVMTPPAAEAAPAQSDDWRVRLYQHTNKIFNK